MMNVQRMTVIFFRYSTVSTFIIVPLTWCPSLSVPVLSFIVIPTPSPLWTVFTHHIFSLTIVWTIKGFEFFIITGGSIHLFITICTIQYLSIHSWFVITISTTVFFLASPLFVGTKTGQVHCRFVITYWTVYINEHFFRFHRKIWLEHLIIYLLNLQIIALLIPQFLRNIDE